MKVIENKDCRVITVVMQGIVITEYSGVIMQIDQSVIKRAADELGLFNTTIVREPDEVEKLATQLESALSTCKQADETIKEKDKTIEALKAEIQEKQEIIKNLSNRIAEYAYNSKYIERYHLVNNDTTIVDSSFEHEPIVCSDSETAKKALKELLNGAEYDKIYDACETSAYWLRFYDKHIELTEVGTNKLVILNNKAIATNLYRLLKCGYITMDNIKELIKTNNK